MQRKFGFGAVIAMAAMSALSASSDTFDANDYGQKVKRERERQPARTNAVDRNEPKFAEVESRQVRRRKELIARKRGSQAGRKAVRP